MTPEERIVQEGLKIAGGGPTQESLRSGLRDFAGRFDSIARPTAPIIPVPPEVRETVTVFQGRSLVGPSAEAPESRLPASFEARIFDGGETLSYRIYGESLEEPE